MIPEHKTSHKQHEYICSNSQKYIVWVKIIKIFFMPKIIRILRSCSMKIFCTFPTINISKLIFWLLICIAKKFIWTMKIFCTFPTVNISKLIFFLLICISKKFIWTTLKMIFSIFIYFCTLRFQIFKYCPIITNHASMEIIFIQKY